MNTLLRVPWSPNTKWLAGFAAAGAFAISALSIWGAGSLTPPPGAPAPTMKTLDELDAKLEKRTPISSVPYFVSAPGSYYLTNNLTGVSGEYGIVVQDNVRDVTIDLNGFAMTGVSGVLDGIRCGATGVSNLIVCNGSVRGWVIGIKADTAVNVVIRDVRVVGNSSTGIAVGNQSTLLRCVVQSNAGIGISGGTGCKLVECTAAGQTGGGDGINLGETSLVVDCVATGNTGDGVELDARCTVSGTVASGNTGRGMVTGAYGTLTQCSANSNLFGGLVTGDGCVVAQCMANENQSSYGITLGTGCLLTSCTVAANTSSLANSGGIQANSDCQIIACIVRSNTTTAGTLTATTGIGINAGFNATIIDCRVSANKGDGIRLQGTSLARGNVCHANGNTTGDGAGIHAISSSNRIEGNFLTNNDRGIDVDTGGNLIIRNTARANTTNYDIVADNRYGEIVNVTATGTAAVTGNAGASTLTSTDSLANFAY